MNVARKKEDARVIRSKRDLAEALAQLLLEKNFDDITIKEISEKALVSKLTFYNNFASKNDLLTFIFNKESCELHDKITAFIKTTADPTAIYRYGIGQVVHYFYARKTQFSKLIKNDHSRTIFWNLTNFIEDLIAQGVTIHGEKMGIAVPKNIVGSYYAGALANCLYKLVEDEVDIPEDKLIDYYYELTFGRGTKSPTHTEKAGV